MATLESFYPVLVPVYLANVTHNDVVKEHTYSATWSVDCSMFVFPISYPANLCQDLSRYPRLLSIKEYGLRSIY